MRINQAIVGESLRDREFFVAESLRDSEWVSVSERRTYGRRVSPRLASASRRDAATGAARLTLVVAQWIATALTAVAIAQDVPSAAIPASPQRVVDLTYAFDQHTIYWPTENGFTLLRGPAGITERGYYYSANRFTAAEHGGTHLDAPIHFYRDRLTAEQIPLERLIGPAAVVDVAKACERDPDYEVSIGDLRGWEEAHGRQLVDQILLIRTGYGRFWPDRSRYLGTTRTGAEAVADLHFPGLAPAAAQWLVEHRAIRCVGIDTASIDRGQSRQFGSHVQLCQHNVPIFENVAHLDQLPTVGSTVIALPMKIAGGSGGPLRIIALLPN